MNFKQFKEKVQSYFDAHLKTLGYEINDIWDGDDYCHACFVRRNGDRLAAVYLGWYAKDDVPFEILERFDSPDEIPAEYGDMRHRDMPKQAPMFIYGNYKRLGDALNALTKGDSLTLRKPIEIFY